MGHHTANKQSGSQAPQGDSLEGTINGSPRWLKTPSPGRNRKLEVVDGPAGLALKKCMHGEPIELSCIVSLQIAVGHTVTWQLVQALPQRTSGMHLQQDCPVVACGQA